MLEVVSFEARDYMYVRMVDYLPRVLAIVHHQVHAVSLERLLESDGDDAYRLGDV